MSILITPRYPVHSVAFSRSFTDKRLWTSSFIWGCLIFAVCNLIGYRLVQIDAKRHPSNENAKAVLANFKHLKRDPEFVLLGSSVMRFPFWMSDIKHSNNVPRFDDYAWCEYLQKQVGKKVNANVSIFDMGIDAAMVSDVYLVCEKLFVGRAMPRLIIYGINPRDFMDALQPSDIGTLPFLRLFEFGDLFRCDGLFATNISEKADLFLQGMVPLYRDRAKWQERLERYYLSALNRLTPHNQNSAMPSGGSLEEQKIAAVDRANLQDGEWVRSVAEYEVRWAKPSEDQFRMQSKYLDALLSLAHKRGITVLLIKMPLTETNKSMMPFGLLAAYNQVLAEEAKRWNIKVIDLPGKFSPAGRYFFDTVHLNALGGDVLTTNLAEQIPQALKLSDNHP